MKLFALPSSGLTEFLSISKEMRALARGMTAEQMRASIGELYAQVPVYVSPDNGNTAELYCVDESGAAHIPIVGMLTPRASPCAAMFGEACTEYGYITAATKAADNDPLVSAIVYDVNSPGGYVDGVDAAAQAVARSSKPTAAHVHGMAASAAYWIASQADEIVAMSPAVQVGSIGVAAEEYDDDEALAKDGIAHRVYTSTDAPDKRPDTKTPEGQSKIVEQLDDMHRVFVGRVAQGRGVSPDVVNAEYGRGALVIASEAMRRGMIDEVEGENISRKLADSIGEADAIAATNNQEVQMDLNQFKAEHPDLYNEAREIGVKEERKRVEELGAFKGHNSDGDRAVEEAIREGKTAAEASPLITAAILKGKGPEADGDNAPAVAVVKPEGGAGADGFDEDDILAMKKFNMTAEEYRKYGKKEAR